MIVNKNEKRIYFDVDDTLVIWPEDCFRPGEGRIEFNIPGANQQVYLLPHMRHIEFLKQQKGRDYEVTVWSAGGWAWAESVVVTLQLTEYVDKVESKPMKYVDDIGADAWMSRIYFESDGYGNTRASTR